MANPHTLGDHLRNGRLARRLDRKSVANLLGDLDILSLGEEPRETEELVFLDGQTTEDMMLCAERALANAIKKGGDRVEVYSSEQYEAEQVGP